MNIYDIYNVINFDFIKIKILKKQVLDCIINLFCFYIYCVNEEQNVEQIRWTNSVRSWQNNWDKIQSSIWNNNQLWYIVITRIDTQVEYIIVETGKWNLDAYDQTSRTVAYQIWRGQLNNYVSPISRIDTYLDGQIEHLRVWSSK